MDVHHLTRTDARRIAVRAQLLDLPRPTGLHEVARHLTVLQADPTAAVAPSADLVVWSRLGAEHRRGDLEDAVAAGSLIELQGMLRPAEDIALFRAEMAVWPGTGDLIEWQRDTRDWLETNDGCRRDILDKLYYEGPLPSSALPDTTVLPWESSGWNNDRNVRMLLGLLVRRGEVAAAGYEGRDRLWDLAERVYPDVPAVPLDQALRIRDERHLRSLGIARRAGQAGERAVVEGLRGTWRVDPSYLDDAFTGRTVLLSPLDRLVFDRKRMEDLFEFDYQLEMYKPAAKRRFGYWAMPILHGDRLVGKLDATADRRAGVLRVDAVHEDESFDKRLAAEVREEIEDLADWLELELEISCG